MLDPEDRAAWTDAYNEALRPKKPPEDDRSGWYVTALAVAFGLVTLWALYAKLPVN